MITCDAPAAASTRAAPNDLMTRALAILAAHVDDAEVIGVERRPATDGSDTYLIELVSDEATVTALIDAANDGFQLVA